MSRRTATIVLVLAVAGLALALVPVVLHSGFGVEIWPLTRLPPAATSIDSGQPD